MIIWLNDKRKLEKHWEVLTPISRQVNHSLAECIRMYHSVGGRQL